MPCDAKESAHGDPHLALQQQLPQQPDHFPESQEGEFSAASAMSQTQSARYMQHVESISSLGGGGCSGMQYHAENVHSLGRYSRVEDLVSSSAVMARFEREAAGPPSSNNCGLRSRLLLAGGEGRTDVTAAGPLPPCYATAPSSAGSAPPPPTSLEASSVDGPNSSGSSGCRRGVRSTVQLGSIKGSGTFVSVSSDQRLTRNGVPSEHLPPASVASAAELNPRPCVTGGREIVLPLGSLDGSGTSREGKEEEEEATQAAKRRDMMLMLMHGHQEKEGEQEGEAEEAVRRRGRMLVIMHGHQARRYRRGSLIMSCQLDLQASGQRTSSSSEEATAGSQGDSFVVTATTATTSQHSSGCAAAGGGGLRGHCVPAAAPSRRLRRASSFSHREGGAGEDEGSVGPAWRHSNPSPQPLQSGTLQGSACRGRFLGHSVNTALGQGL